MTRWWRNLFSFSFAWIFRETSKTNRQQFFTVCTLIDHRNDVKMFKTLQWARGSTWFLNILTSFPSMVEESTGQSETTRDWFDWFGEEREFKTFYFVLFPYIFLEIRMFSVLGHTLQVVNLLDRLIKKENQTATVPLVSDIPPYVDNCQVVICNERGGRSIQSFGNPACASGRYENLTSLFS